MLNCCEYIRNTVPGLISNADIRKSFVNQSHCTCKNMCIGKYDIICTVAEDTLSFAEEILDDLKIISAVSPNANIVTFDGEKKLYIIALPLYARKIKKIISLSTNSQTNAENSTTFMIDETEITVCETLCRLSSSERDTYSKDKLFGMIYVLLFAG